MIVLKYLTSVVVVWLTLVMGVVCLVALAVAVPIAMIFSSNVDKSKWPLQRGWYREVGHE